MDLGEVLVELGGQSSRPGGQRSSALLCVLTLNVNRRVSTDTLIDAIWADRADERSAAALDTLVWRLRRVLEPRRGPRQPAEVLINDAGGYRLLLNEDQVDSHRFEVLANESRDLLVTGDPDRAVRRCEHALQLWRGEPFGIHGDDAWAIAARNRLAAIRAEVRERRVEGLLALGNSTRAAADAAELVHDLPFQESVWHLLMLACYRAGRTKDALHHFQQVRHLLLDQLGSEPSRKLVELQRQILCADAELDPGNSPNGHELHPTAPVAPPTSTSATDSRAESTPAVTAEFVRFPHWRTALIGRVAELSQLAERVPKHTLTTIVGAAGCGKTRLAVAVARSCRTSFPDGAWFVDLSAIDSPDLVIEVTMSTLGLSVQPGTALDQLRSHVRNRRMLIVLDNCEHVLADVRTMTEAILDTDVESCVLATSREPLDLDGELTWTLTPLPTSPRFAESSADDLVAFGVAPEDPSPAAQLFVARLAQVQPHLDLDATTLRTIERICVAADGLPLALELGAARARTYTLAEIAQQITTDSAAIARPGADRGARRHTVGAAIDGSYRLLNEDEQAAYRRLSVLPSVFDLTAAAAVIECYEGEALPPTTQLLADLVHRSLVVSRSSEHPSERSSFYQLATVRAHAGRAARSTGDEEPAARGRDRWVTELMSRRPPISRADYDGWYVGIDSAFDTIRATLHHTLIDDPSPTGLHIMGGLTNYWMLGQRIPESSRWLEAAVQLAGPASADGALIRASYASGRMMLGRLDEARQAVQELCAYASTIESDDEDVVAALSLMALTALTVDADLSVSSADRVVALSRRYPANQTIGQLSAANQYLSDTVRQTAVDEVHLESLYHQCIATGNLLGGWVSAGILAVRSIGKDPAVGLMFLDRVIDAMLGLGAPSVAIHLEYRANLMLQLGSPILAVIQHASARAEIRRGGMRWPQHEGTTEALARARDVLGQAVFDESWRRGSGIDTGEARAIVV